MNTFTGIDHEQGIMCSALDQLPVQVKKLVRLPVQVGTGMRALIVIGEEFTIFMYDKNRPGLMADFHLKTLAAGVFNIGRFAEYMCHNVC